jgi:hypothetical protein
LFESAEGIAYIETAFSRSKVTEAAQCQVIQELTRPTVVFCAVILALNVTCTVGIPVAASASIVKDRPFSPEIGSSDVDSFGYSASFRLPGGIEGLLIRSYFAVTYVYQSQPPIISELYMSVQMAFYYGKIVGFAVIGKSRIGFCHGFPSLEDGECQTHSPGSTVGRFSTTCAGA